MKMKKMGKCSRNTKEHKSLFYLWKFLRKAERRDALDQIKCIYEEKRRREISAEMVMVMMMMMIITLSMIMGWWWWCWWRCCLWWTKSEKIAGEARDCVVVTDGRKEDGAIRGEWKLLNKILVYAHFVQWRGILRKNKWK